MQTYLECIPCIIRQTLDAVRRATDDEAVHEKVLREALDLVSKMDLRESPPAMAQRIHRFIRETTGNDDPYRIAKEDSNRFVLELYPKFKKAVEDSHNALETAARLAIGGNIIDLGAKHQQQDLDVHGAIEDSLTVPLFSDGLEGFRTAIESAKDILYIGDNAGEIVFDKLLIEQMPHEKITFAVRGNPVINDATMADARMVGLTDLVEVIDNGSDAPGTILKTCSEDFRRRFDAADLIIAKGQGNYETLSTVSKKIFFLLKTKCPVSAEDIGCEVGNLVLCRSNAAVFAAEK